MGGADDGEFGGVMGKGRWVWLWRLREQVVGDGLFFFRCGKNWGVCSPVLGLGNLIWVSFLFRSLWGAVCWHFLGGGWLSLGRFYVRNVHLIPLFPFLSSVCQIGQDVGSGGGQIVRR